MGWYAWSGDQETVPHKAGERESQRGSEGSGRARVELHQVTGRWQHSRFECCLRKRQVYLQEPQDIQTQSERICSCVTTLPTVNLLLKRTQKLFSLPHPSEQRYPSSLAWHEKAFMTSLILNAFHYHSFIHLFSLFHKYLLSTKYYYALFFLALRIQQWTTVPALWSLQSIGEIQTLITIDKYKICQVVISAF